MAKLVLNQLNLVVRDMDASLEFYRKLGVSISEAAVWSTDSGTHHVEVPMPDGLGLDLDSAALAHGYNQGLEPGAGAHVLIGFSVESREAVDAHYDDVIAAGYLSLQPPYDAFWGSRYAIVEDPDGNRVGIMSPRDPARRSAPPPV